jgi:uncharacterized protein (TIGR02996 family)
MTDEAALLAAIVAHPDEDTPRLAYADWLDEHNDPDRAEADRAEFIRAQCRFTHAAASQSDYPDFFDNCFSSFVRAAWWLYPNQLELPPGFVRVNGEHPEYGMYRRGLQYRVRGDWDYDYGEPDEEIIDQICAGLEKLVTTTTVRSLDLRNATPEQVARVLAAPGAEALQGLWVGPSWTNGDEIARVLASAKSARGLMDLALGVHLTGRGVKALAGTKFTRLEAISLPALNCTAAARTELFAAPWFRKLKNVTAAGMNPASQSALFAALARLPKLDKLFLEIEDENGLRALSAANGFPELGWLEIKGAACSKTAEAFARGSLPKLRTLTALGVQNGAFRKVVAAPWFAGLLSLDLSFGTLTDRSVQAIARSPAAANLRTLQLCDNPIGPATLQLIADGTIFPNMRRLDLDHDNGEPKVAPPDVRRFLAALSLPHLVDLYMDGWPLHTAGAVALAANPSVANLIGLSLNRSGLTDRGFDALVRSPHLQQLELFKATDNRITDPGALRRRKFLPVLRDMWLTGNRISPRPGARLKRARKWVMEYHQ